MSNQSYSFNPQDDRLGIAGSGFRYPCLTTTGRLGVPVSTEDAGLTVFDTTLKQLFVWTGVAWTQLKRKPFDPADFGANYSWWAARLESYANGALVPTWTDHGSGTLTVTGAVGQEPEFRDGTDPVAPNGQPCVRWVNGNRLLNAATGVTGPYTAAIVCRPTSIPVTNTPIIGGTSLLATSAIRLQTTSGGRYLVYAGSGNSIPNALFHPISPVGWQVIVVTFNTSGATRVFNGFKSGLAIAPSPANYLTASYSLSSVDDFSAGTFALGGNGYVGEIAEAVLWRSDMSNANKITIGKQLCNLYGISY